jgi:tetratricopeptide (TPR) repeat protein
MERAEWLLLYYERATQLDPSYALAWAGLSRVRKWQAKTSLIPTEQGYRLAREEVQRALALDPNLAQAHIQLGRIQQQVDFDWTGADASYQRAVELEPGNPESVGQAASSAAFLGHFDRALLLSRRTIDLDPLNATSWVRLGQIECWSGQLDAAIPDLKKALDLNRNLWSADISLSQIYIMQGRPQDALPEIELIRYDLWRAVQHAVAYYALGRQKEADAALSELIARYHARSAHAHSAYSAYGIAQVYAFRKQSDEAFQWLDRAYAYHDDGLIETKVDPLLKNLHNDPRYTALLKKLNLPN